MKRLGWYFNKFALALTLSAAFWTVLPFVALIIDACINGHDSIIKISLDYLVMTWKEANGE